MNRPSPKGRRAPTSKPVDHTAGKTLTPMPVPASRVPDDAAQMARPGARHARHDTNGQPGQPSPKNATRAAAVAALAIRFGTTASPRYEAFTSILRSCSMAVADLGKRTFNTPLSNCALIFDVSTEAGMRNVRWNDPKLRSRRW